MQAHHLVRSAVLTLAIATLVGCASPAGQSIPPEVSARLQQLEDIEGIRTLFADYGRTLDDRDFAAFSQLWATESEFAGGAGNVALGPAAIGALLEKLIEGNFPDSAGTNAHLFFNERIQLDGDAATAVSKGGFMVASAENQPVMSILATYEDQLVREDGRWKFARRAILGNIPVPRR
jgi:uncharacterized protein (TIGR02246 family)